MRDLAVEEADPCRHKYSQVAGNAGRIAAASARPHGPRSSACGAVRSIVPRKWDYPPGSRIGGLAGHGAPGGHVVRRSAPRRATDTVGLEILATARQAGQIEHVGQRIERLLVRATPAVAGPTRGLGVPANRSGRLHGTRGVRRWESVHHGSRASAGHRARVADIVSLVRLEAEDWPAVGRSRCFRACFSAPWPAWDEGRALVAVDRTLRKLRVPSGRTELLASPRNVRQSV